MPSSYFRRLDNQYGVMEGFPYEGERALFDDLPVGSNVPTPPGGVAQGPPRRSARVVRPQPISQPAYSVDWGQYATPATTLRRKPVPFQEEEIDVSVDKDFNTDMITMMSDASVDTKELWRCKNGKRSERNISA